MRKQRSVKIIWDYLKIPEEDRVRRSFYSWQFLSYIERFTLFDFINYIFQVTKESWWRRESYRHRIYSFATVVLLKTANYQESKLGLLGYIDQVHTRGTPPFLNSGKLKQQLFYCAFHKWILKLLLKFDWFFELFSSSWVGIETMFWLCTPQPSSKHCRLGSVLGISNRTLYSV